MRENAQWLFRPNSAEPGALMFETDSAAKTAACRLPRSARGGPHAAAAVASISVHAAMISALYLAMSPLAPPPAQSSVAVEFEPLAAVPLATVAADRLTTPATASLSALNRAVPGRSVHATAPNEAPHQARALPVTPAASPQTQAAAPAAHPAHSPGEVAGLELRIREAVRAAAAYPAVARQMRREGRAQIGFAYIDGAVQEIALIHSSRSDLLDEAALTAVRKATYPLPPPGMTGVRLALEVWVSFGLKAE